ncbi:hypothetical protein SAMN04487943_101443 [Gracilibacillus orientalis]|uniref:RsgI N-terminal anti-sigma domain-containing protein n=1 Tax=Gracilibacillus orientalis TaxID=334253 RepID=A0A1I4HIX8_9BACI|nr:hypothetical protein [Gracilibacillus orientalis]SFL41653.1 hypothetical protein SAMN04487943_101443 [Gracilibacillus orientalis]
MKKGIIVEHTSRYTIVMDKNGVFHRAVPMKEKEIGTETFYQQKKSVLQSFFNFFKGSITWKLVPMVLICLLLLSPLYIWLAGNKAYAVVSIDINPSLNITIDEQYQVLDVEPMNDDAEQLMDNLEVKNRTITSLTDEIIDKVTVNTEAEADRPVLMAVSYYDENNQDHHFEDELGSYYQQLGYQVAIYEVSKELRAQAETDHVSMNELTAQSLEESLGSEVKQISTENDTLETSLDTEERELIENFYNHNEQEQEEEVNQEEIEIDETEQEENLEDIEENNQGESKKETNDPAILPANASERAKEQKSVNNGKKQDNHGQKVGDEAKTKTDNQDQKANKKTKEQTQKKTKEKNNKKKKQDNKNKKSKTNKNKKSDDKKSTSKQNNKPKKKDKPQKQHPGKGHNK